MGPRPVPRPDASPDAAPTARDRMGSGVLPKTAGALVALVVLASAVWGLIRTMG